MIFIIYLNLQNNCNSYQQFWQAKRKQLPNNRIPGLLAILKSLTPTNSGATAVFSDPTGIAYFANYIFNYFRI